MGDKPLPPSTPAASQRTESIRSGVQWYDSPSASFQRRVKSDVPKNTEVDEDPFFGKKVDEETSNSCDGFSVRVPHSSRNYRRRLRPSSDGMNLKGGEKTDHTESELSSSPVSSNSFNANGDPQERGRRSLQLMKKRCNAIATTTDGKSIEVISASDIATPKRKRKFEDEEEEEEGGAEEVEDREEEGDENRPKKSESNLLTPSLSRGSASKRGCVDGAGTSTDPPLPGTPLACLSLHSSVTPRRGRSSKRDELIDTPESSQKEEGKERTRMKDQVEKDKKTIRREKYGDRPDFDSDDSFYDSD